MNSSTLLLLRQFKGYIVAGMISVFLAMLAISYIKPSDLSNIVFALSISSIFALAFSGNSEFYGRIFPFSNRQIAWIPIGVWALSSLAGGLGILYSQLFSKNNQLEAVEVFQYWYLSGSYIMPAAFFLLLIWRICLRYWSLSIYITFPIYLTGWTGDVDKILSSYALTQYVLPWALGCIFLLVERPYLVSKLRQHAASRTGQYVWMSTSYLPNEILKPHTSTRIADVFTILLVLVVGGNYMFSHILHQPSNLEAIMSLKSGNVIFAAIIGFVAHFILEIWRRNRASGMSCRRAIVALLLEFTVIGYVWRDKLGVVSGTPIRCGSCQGWRMAWMTKCPHCANVNIDEQTEPSVSKLLKSLRGDLGATFFRLGFPVFLVLYIIISS